MLSLSLLRPQLLLELLVAELQLLNRAGELADLRFQLIDAHRHLGLIGAAALRLLAWLTEQIVQEIPRPLLREHRKRHEGSGKRRH